MKSFKKGLKQIARESYLQGIADEARKRGLATRKLRAGGLTVANIQEFAQRRGLVVNVRQDGVTVDVAKAA
jgi:hypothetical protein